MIEKSSPEKKCCGMPAMLEGDRQLTLEFVRHNMDMLAEAVASGYDIVCSCPTCGFMLRNVLKEGAYYSAEYQAAVGADGAYLKIPAPRISDNPGGNGTLQQQQTEYCDSECRRSGAPFDQWTRNDDHANTERDLSAFR